MALTSLKLTTESVVWQTLMNDLTDYVPNEIKPHLLHIIKELRRENKQHNISWINNELLHIESCIDRTWETLNSGHWKDVPTEYRYAYTFCSFMKAMLLELRNCLSSNHMQADINNMEAIIEQVDKGLLLGAPLPRNPTLLTDVASRVNEQLFNKSKKLETDEKVLINEDDISTPIFPGFETIKYYTEPSMETFYRDIFSQKVPVILKGCLTHWRALNLWRDTEYLKKIIGCRTVPIEIGSRYTEEDWTQSLITFAEFLQKHINNRNNKIGYLAQHQLFEQVPELKKDFSIPEYCSFSDKDEADELPDINAWFGPNGTISPLHFDPKNNLLCQVFGCKRIILYSPDDTSNLYPYETRMLNNTAQVDPYKPDDTNFPNFHKAQGFMCYLKPGEMLYIPPRWWHHVTSLSPSFSVSFWWE